MCSGRRMDLTLFPEMKQSLHGFGTPGQKSVSEPVMEVERRFMKKALLSFRFSAERNCFTFNKERGIPGPFFYFPEKFSPPQNGEFFESQKEEHFHFSKNSPGETGTSFCLKKEFEHRENGRKEIRTSDLYS